MDSSLRFTYSSLHLLSHSTQNQSWHQPLGYPVYMGGSSALCPTALVQGHRISLLIPPAGLLTSLPDSSPSVSKQAEFFFTKFLLFPYPRQNTNSPWPLLMWFRHIYPASFSSFFPLLFAPVFLGSPGLFVQRRHCVWSFLPLHMCSSLLVHFVFSRAI